MLRRILAGEEIGPSCYEIGKRLCDITASGLVSGALALTQVRKSLEALLCAPLEELIAVHRVVRILVAVVRLVSELY